jgi:histone H3/H4
VIQVKGSNKRFPRTKDSYMQDTSDLAKRSIMDGDSFLPGPSNSWRFARNEVEPYMKSQRPGLPWFKVKRVSREEYQEMVERRKAMQAAEAKAEAAKELPEMAGEEVKRRSPKEKMDQAWDDAGM